jgi:glycosyltransferase involved in cell wall biosynthesis
MSMVSVIIPAYSAAGYIDRTLRSVFSQACTDLEVIVINDGSPDTPALVEALMPWRDRIVYREQENAGAGAARNAGLAMARGDLVAFLDADDRWRPGFLDAQVRWLESRPDFDMVYCDAVITGDTPLAGKRFSETAPSDGPVTFESLLTQRCTVITSSVVARHAVIGAAGGFDAGLRRGQDFDLWLRLAHRGARIGYQAEPLVERVVLASGLSADPVTELDRAIRVLHGVARKLPLAAVERALLHDRITALGAAVACERGKRDLRARRFADARQHFLESIALSPQWKLRVVLTLMGVAPRTFQRVYMRLRPPSTAEALAIQN